MTHLLAKLYGERALARAVNRTVAAHALSTRWVRGVRVDAVDGGLEVVCELHPAWWMLLGAFHLVVRRRVRRRLDEALEKWSNAKVVSLWVL